MVIEKGVDWGRPLGSDESVTTFDSPSELCSAWLNGEVLGVVSLNHNDFRAEVGDAVERSDRWVVPVDMVRVKLDDSVSTAFMLHLTAGVPFRSPNQFWVMNCGYYRGYRLAPKAHPNDGHFDIVKGRIGPSELPMAKRRSRTGEHLCHPGFSVARSARESIDFAKRTKIYCDKKVVGRFRSIELIAVPDAILVAI